MEKELIRLKILKINETVFDEDVKFVTLPSISGEVTILPGHEPLVTILQQGKIFAGFAGERREFDIERGYVEVTKEQISVLLS